MFCVKFSIHRLEVVSKCYRGSSFMECNKFIFKKLVIQGYKLVVIAIVVNSYLCTGYYSIKRLLCDFRFWAKEHSSPPMTGACKQTVIQ